MGELGVEPATLGSISPLSNEQWVVVDALLLHVLYVLAYTVEPHMMQTVLVLNITIY